MSHSIRTLVATVLAVGVASWVVPERIAAQSTQLPPAAQRTGNLPLRNVQSSYTPAGKRVSPQDGIVMQIKPNGQTPRRKLQIEANPQASAKTKTSRG